jgi:hypothetical protein
MPGSPAIGIREPLVAGAWEPLVGISENNVTAKHKVNNAATKYFFNILYHLPFSLRAHQ